MLISQGLTRLATIVARVAGALAAFSLIMMMLQTVLEVGLRYFLNAPIEGNLEIVSYYYMVAVVFLPLGLVELSHEHINVDLFLTRFSRRVQNMFYLLASALAFLFLGMLFFQTFLDALKATRINEVIMGSTLVVVWPAKWALPIGFAAMLIAIAANMAAALRDLDRFEPRPRDPVAD